MTYSAVLALKKVLPWLTQSSPVGVLLFRDASVPRTVHIGCRLNAASRVLLH